MFGSKKLTVDSFSNLVAEGTEVTGTVKFTGTLLIRGTVNGNIVVGLPADEKQTPRRDCISVASTGVVTTEEMTASNIVIEGKVNTKKIWAEINMRISATAEIENAQIYYRILEIEQGAILKNCTLKHLDHAPEGEIV